MFLHQLTVGFDGTNKHLKMLFCNIYGNTIFTFFPNAQYLSNIAKTDIVIEMIPRSLFSLSLFNAIVEKYILRFYLINREDIKV